MGTAVFTGFDGALAPLVGCISMVVSLISVPVLSRVLAVRKGAVAQQA